MKAHIDNDNYTLYLGDCLEVIKCLPEGSINCIITSPPYYNLRCYTDSDKEIGIEDDVDTYINKLYKAFT